MSRPIKLAQQQGRMIDQLFFITNPDADCYVRKLLPGEAEWQKAVFVHVKFDRQDMLASHKFLDKDFLMYQCPDHPYSAKTMREMADHAREQWLSQTNGKAKNK